MSHRLEAAMSRVQLALNVDNLAEGVGPRRPGGLRHLRLQSSTVRRRDRRSGDVLLTA
jgi:hypothetical protein